jgi:hypothetical protein
MMAEVLLNLLFLCLGIVLTILASFVGAWLQDRYWRHQKREQDRDKRIADATQVVEEVASAADTRLYFQRQFAWALAANGRLDVALADYRAAVRGWNTNLGRIKSKLWTTFGRQSAIELEENIHDEFAAIGRILEGVFREKAPIARVRECEDRLNTLGYRIHIYVRDRLALIKHDKLPGIPDSRDISYENRNNLSVYYLTYRLLGLEKR